MEKIYKTNKRKRIWCYIQFGNKIIANCDPNMDIFINEGILNINRFYEWFH